MQIFKVLTEHSGRTLFARVLLLVLAVSISTAALNTGPVSAVGPDAVRTGFDSSTLARNDDGSTGLVSFGFSDDIDFFGTEYGGAYVNNNGNITFDSPLATFTPFGLSGAARVIIAPFFGDVDTRVKGDPVRYGSGTVDGRDAWGATYVNADCYNGYNARTNANSFQVVLIERFDTGAGNFDIEFNYDQIEWEAGQASWGSVDCLGGLPARIGYSNGSIIPAELVSYELPGSGVAGAFLDSGPAATSLIQNSLNSDQDGRYVFSVRGGVVAPDDTTPPTISVELSDNTLWPPNHKMVDISVDVTAEDDSGDVTVVLTSITSSEDDNGKGVGDGNTNDDIQGAEFGTLDTEFQLRAERAGKGSGRVYTITYTASDAAGNTAEAVVEVAVAKSKGR